MTKMKLLAASLMASTLLAAPALAQSTSAPPSKPAPAATEVQKNNMTTSPTAATPAKPMASNPAAAQTAQQTGQWRASKFVGLNVYNSANEKIGDINELVMGSDGQIDLVVVGVGGFLGMGEHNVALKWSQVKFVNEAARTASSTPPTTARTTGSGTAAPVNAANASRDYPDHAVISMTKEELKALPQFKYVSDQK
jgi:sporulation protein YlmC with PRC-barrel domain